ncbi:hypothetical protein K438DRAFT_1988973 [Mycena galopus ATCC 62051]|nr:hypothetical protein K438DRAFT_1988973 [Mycena galopus ATCC 62051]
MHKIPTAPTFLLERRNSSRQTVVGRIHIPRERTRQSIRSSTNSRSSGYNISSLTTTSSPHGATFAPTPFVFGAPPPPHPTLLHPSHPSTSSSAAASVLPPVHTALPTLPRTFLAEYNCTITRSAIYLGALTNG